MHHPALTPRPRPPLRRLSRRRATTLVGGSVLALVLLFELCMVSTSCATPGEGLDGDTTAATYAEEDTHRPFEPDRIGRQPDGPSTGPKARRPPSPAGHRQNVPLLSWEQLEEAPGETSATLDDEGSGADHYVGRIVLEERIDGVAFDLTLEEAVPGVYLLDLFRRATCDELAEQMAALPEPTERVTSFVVTEDGAGRASGLVTWDAGAPPALSFVLEGRGDDVVLAEVPAAAYDEGETGPTGRGVVPSALLLRREGDFVTPDDEGGDIPGPDEEAVAVEAAEELPVGAGCVDLEL